MVKNVSGELLKQAAQLRVEEAAKQLTEYVRLANKAGDWKPDSDYELLRRDLTRTIGDVVARLSTRAVIPLADHIVITPLTKREVTPSGLVIPDTITARPQQGEVVAVGPGRLDANGDRVAIELSIGDRIVYGRHTGTEITIDNIDYIILEERDVLAKLIE